MMKPFEIRAPETSEEVGDFAPIVAWAYNDTPEGARRWLERSRREDLRLVRASGRVIGGLAQIPMGQWFGGQSVSTLGIAGVAIAASARGGGVAIEMIRSVLDEARRAGFALSTLYPSTVALYRKAGYELAGSYCRTTLRLGALTPRNLRDKNSDCELRDATDADQPDIERLYSRVARERPGYLDRHRYIWDRVREYNGRKTQAVVVRGQSGLEGYAFLGQRGSDVNHHDLRMTDFVSVTPGAAARLVDFLAYHRSTADHALWFGGPSDDRLLALPDKGYKVEVDSYWMLRMLDVGAALSARGYPAVEREVVLDLQDSLFRENHGCFRLAVAGGRAEVTRSERSAGVRIGVHALASLYTGFASVNELSRAGLLEGDAASLSTLGLFFTNTAPALCDFF